MRTLKETERLRILVVAVGEPWPLDSGGRLHLYHVLDQIDERAEVTLLLPRAAQHLQDLPRPMRVIALSAGETPALPTETPAPPTNTAAPTNSPLMRSFRRYFGHNAQIEAWLRRQATRRRYDVIMLNGAVLGQHIDACRAPVVWNPQDELVLPTLRAAQFSPYARWLPALRRSLFYAIYERYVARRAAATIYVSRIDAAYARTWAGDARLEVVQNGVDFDAFRPAESPAEPGTVVFVGALEFPPNVDAVRNFAGVIWPHIHAGGHDRRLLIVGRRPTPEVRALAGIPGVSVIPDVPDVRPYLERAAVVIVPIRTGGGLKNKVLEGCALRRPVVAHPRALAGLSARIGHDLLSAAETESWVRAVARLLQHPAHAERIARNGYEWVTRAHSWETTGCRFFEILSAAAGRRKNVASPQRAPDAAAQTPTIKDARVPEPIQWSWPSPVGVVASHS